MPTPAFGNVWDADLEPVNGHEQWGFRPVLIIFNETFNEVPRGFCIAVPIARSDRGVRSQTRVDGGESGLVAPSVIMCEQVRSLSVTRLKRRRGVMDAAICDLAAARVASFVAPRDGRVAKYEMNV